MSRSRRDVNYSINESCLEQLFGKDVCQYVLYGLAETKYLDIKHAINHLALKQAYDYCSVKITNLFSPEYRTARTHAKDTITNILIENYKREKSGKPLLGLIFCVAYNDEFKKFSTDLSRVAQSSSKTSRDTITDAEIRRVYKHYQDTNQEVQEIAKKTFKFVSVNVKEKNITLVEDKTFLEDSILKEKLKARAANAELKVIASNPSKLFWRDILKDEITSIDPAMKPTSSLGSP